MTFRYIGSKSRIADELKKHIGNSDGGRFVDAFCGTGAVAEIAADLGWKVSVNDNMSSSAVISAARLISKEEAPFIALGGYRKAVAALNELQGCKGFMWREYTPAALHNAPAKVERRYFTEANASRIDSVRKQISDWLGDGLINPSEEMVLIADLLGAVNRVANIAGTYGCFLSKWTPQSAQTLTLRPRELRSHRVLDRITIGDVMRIPVAEDDTVYLDPPYTKRQYASYYHILETVAVGDEPIVEGVCGLRPWKDRASDFCYKTRALAALENLIRSLPARRILLSYSDEGHVKLPDLQRALNDIGQIETIQLKDIGRYRPNKKAVENRSSVSEYLMVIERCTAQGQTFAMEAVA